MIETRRYFDRRARAFDRVYARPSALRRGPRRGRALAAEMVAGHEGPSVLDVGCGPGRVGEAVLAAGAASYVGIDISPRMLVLARARLGGDPRVELLEGDFLGPGLELAAEMSFDVVLALGLFDYVEEPLRAAEWLRARCSSTLVASFTRWDWLKGPPRRLEYTLHRLPVRDYDTAGVVTLLSAAGFGRVDVAANGRRGFHVVAAIGGVG
jgi:SAM-dependent methyltransferase